MNKTEIWAFTVYDKSENCELCKGIVLAADETEARKKLHEEYDSVYDGELIDETEIYSIDDDINYNSQTNVYEAVRFV